MTRNFYRSLYSLNLVSVIDLRHFLLQLLNVTFTFQNPDFFVGKNYHIIINFLNKKRILILVLVSELLRHRQTDTLMFFFVGG